ncbi:hypothetical protein [Sphingomonas jatrophae]|uniref:Tetratricopeptide repeat-containing protein n=1 Tax=Sphingomonas jatrophae TaxID=1166337 RepID=A0A1I6JCV7_9SPHN|nr:hypothetical protein [Sphingomonas jatrophae]SFR76788.1 hypothetical protein SAMN05192580_0118 [Sphingomonas jatrophae]
MRKGLGTIFGSCLVLLTGAAVAQPAEDYAPGALALSAMERQDWAAAERALTSGSAKDAGQLINLGEVYYRSGRPTQAAAAWRAAAEAKPVLVYTRDGRVVSTADLAREALARRELGGR